MYSKQQSSRIKKEFWTTFGRYMKPLPNSDGEAVNWLNYKTGIKHIFFRLDADEEHASIAIELHHPDTEARLQCFDQFVQLKPLFAKTLGQDWSWQKEIADEHGKNFSRIGMELTGISVLKTNDWPAIISFLKPAMILLDAFWNPVKDSFL